MSVLILKPAGYEAPSLKNSYLPGFTFDIVIMEDLGSYQLLRDQLNQGSMDLSVVEALTGYITKLHRSAHRAIVDGETHQKMVEFCK